MNTGDRLRKAMAKFATGVIILTTKNQDGTVQAMTANAFASITLDPPLVMVSVGFSRNTHLPVKQSGRYAISILRSDQEEAAIYYSKRDDERSKLEPMEFQSTKDGMPVLKDSLAYLDCKVVASHEYGDHAIFVAEVIESWVSEGIPLIFYDRAFGSFIE